MKQDILIVIDMQNDFVSGSLGSREAEGIVPAVVKKVQEFSGDVIFTKDTHFDNYADTQEGKLLPVSHCVKGTKGWELVPELECLAQRRKAAVYEKETFGCRRLAEDLRKKNDAVPVESITLVGVCTDICVVSNALLIKAALPEVPVFVEAGCCAGVTVEKHRAALETMRSCQIHVVE